MASGIFQCPVAAVFAFPHTGFPLTEMARNDLNVVALEVDEHELRACMLPSLITLPDGKSIELQKVTNSHFNKRRPASR